MAISCSSTSLTGQDGSVYFTPAGTHACLEDSTDFDKVAGTINVGSEGDFQLGDPVIFKVEGTAKLDSALTAGTTYYVIENTAGKVKVGATAGSTPIALNGDGGVTGTGLASFAAGSTAGAGYTAGTYNNVQLKQGANVTATATVVVPAGGALAVSAITIKAGGSGYNTSTPVTLTGGADNTGKAIDAVPPTTPFSGTAVLTAYQDTPGKANHVAMTYAKFDAVCSVKSFSLDLSREEIDITTLPCGVGTGGGKYARFRTQMAGYASGSGTMEVLFTSDQTSLANRLLANSMLRSQSGATVKLYIETVAGSGANANVPDDTKSLYIEAPISIAGMSLSVSPDDVTTATLNFNLAGQPTHMLGIKLS